MHKTVVIITIKSPDGQHIRDTREVRMSDLVDVLNSYLNA